MQISQCYQILEVSPHASDEEIATIYKQLAMKFHPDRNRDRLEWAHEKMSSLNQAYSTIMGHRFSQGMPKTRAPEQERRQQPAREKPAEREKSRQQEPGPRPANKKRNVDEQLDEVTRESVIRTFGKIRESVNDSLYRFFQYNLYNLIRRDEVFNRGTFNSIVMNLRRSFHAVKKLHGETRDLDVRRHLDVFNAMIFNFYKASECLNVIDSYNDLYDVQAYRQYKKADDLLQHAQKEIFYDRHNRGYPKIEHALALVIQAQKIFKSVLAMFSDSSWAVETGIKLSYATAFREYVELFFSEEE